LAAPEGGAVLALATPARRRTTTFGSWEDCDIPEEFPDSDGTTRKLQQTRKYSEDGDTDVPDSEAYTLSPNGTAFTLTPLSNMESPSFWPPADLDHAPKRRTRGTTLGFDDDFNDDIPDEWSVKNPARCPYYHLAPKTTMEGRAVEQMLFAYGEQDEYDPRNPRYLQPADTQQVVESTARQLQRQIARLQNILKAREKLEPASSTAMQTYKRVLEELRADFADLGVELEPIEEPPHQRGCDRSSTMDVPMQAPPASQMDTMVSDRKKTW